MSHRIPFDLRKAPFLMVDPGDTGTINMDRWGGVVPVVTAAAETRTLAQPTKAGLQCTVVLDVDVGDLTLTVTGGYNAAAQEDIVFDDAGDWATFASYKSGSSYLWGLVAQQGTDASFTGGGTVTAETITALTATTALITSLFARGRIFRNMPTPATATATATLTDAQMICGILVATPTAAAAYTVRTGTQLDAALVTAGYTMAADDSLDLVIINLGGTGDDITLTAATGITIVGDPVVGPLADVATEQAGQGTFRLRRTAANTFVAYRIS